MAEATRILAGVTPETYKEMQQGPGLILVNFDYQDIKTAAEFAAAMQTAIQERRTLGATRGGISVNVTPTTRQREVDGVIARMVGDSVISGWECYMTTNLLEFNPATLQAVFPTAEFTQTEADNNNRRITAMRIRTALNNEDYVQNYTFVGSTDYGWIMVSFHNALGQLTGDISTESDGEAQIPFRADGFLGPGAMFETGGLDYAPVEVWLIDRMGGTISKEMVGGDTGA